MQMIGLDHPETQEAQESGLQKQLNSFGLATEKSYMMLVQSQVTGRFHHLPEDSH